jgi:hypothetical protein
MRSTTGKVVALRDSDFTPLVCLHRALEQIDERTDGIIVIRFSAEEGYSLTYARATARRLAVGATILQREASAFLDEMELGEAEGE